MPIVNDDMLCSPSAGRITFDIPEADESIFCVTCRYLSAHGTCLSAKCPHKTIAPNKEETNDDSQRIP